MKDKEIIVVDLETTSVIVNDAEIRVFGAYDPNENKFYIYKWSDQALAKVMKLFEEYKYIITFNGAKYDMPILERHGVPVGNYNHIDVRQVYKNRAPLIKRGGFQSYSLKNLVIDLGLDGEGSKGEIDYEIFKKEQWTPQEQEQIIVYLKQDLKSTWNLWNYLTIKFEPLSKYIKAVDVEKYKHITTSLPTYTYKVLCHMTSVTELYDEAPRPRSLYTAQKVITNPRKEINTNAVLLRVPHIYAQMIQQFNLLSFDCKCCLGNEGKFHGKNFFTMEGFYCQKNHGRIERFLKKLYRNTDSESKLVGAIISKHIYEVISNPKYYATYHPSVAKDLIALVRHQLNIMSRMFDEKGYLVIGIDIDNIFIIVDEVNGKSVEELLIIRDEIITYLQSKMPFKCETFDIEFVTKLKYLRFKRKSEKVYFLERGQYLYITPENKIVSKGLTPEEVLEWSNVP